MNNKYDYVIVGAGSAGCILANRLSQSGEHQVLLLETGGTDKSIFIQMPTALSYPMNTQKYAWQFHSQAETGLEGRQMHCPRGKVLGGSSSINGMVYVRGHAMDLSSGKKKALKVGIMQAVCLILRSLKHGKTVKMNTAVVVVQ